MALLGNIWYDIFAGILAFIVIFLLILGLFYAWSSFTHYILKRRYDKNKDYGRRNEGYPGGINEAKSNSGGLRANNNVSERSVLQTLASEFNKPSSEEPKRPNDILEEEGNDEQLMPLNVFSKK